MGGRPRLQVHFVSGETQCVGVSKAESTGAGVSHHVGVSQAESTGAGVSHHGLYSMSPTGP